MLDTHAIARRLTAAGLSADQADAITSAVRLAAEAGGAVTPDMLRAEIETIRAEIETVRTEIETVRTEVGAVRAEIYRVAVVQTVAIVGAVVAIMRVLG